MGRCQQFDVPNQEKLPGGECVDCVFHMHVFIIFFGVLIIIRIAFLRRPRSVSRIAFFFNYMHVNIISHILQLGLRFTQARIGIAFSSSSASTSTFQF